MRGRTEKDARRRARVAGGLRWTLFGGRVIVVTPHEIAQLVEWVGFEPEPVFPKQKRPITRGVFGKLVLSDAHEARRRFVEALEESRGVTGAAGERLGICRATVYLCVERWGLWGDLERIRERRVAEGLAVDADFAAATLRELFPGEAVKPKGRRVPVWWSRRRTK